MAQALTKAELLKGKEAVRTVPIEALEGGEVMIRPLTDGEFHEIQQLFVEAVTMKLDISPEEMQSGELVTDETKLSSRVDTTIDVGQFARADYKSSLLAAAYGLSVNGVKWTKKEVMQLPPGSAEQIADEVYDLSGARPEQEAVLRRFRGDSTGTSDDQDSTDGGPPGSDTDGSDPGAAHLPGRGVEPGESDGGAAD